MNCANEKTAKIIAFPQRRDNERSRARLRQLEAEARKFTATEFGSGWYHDAAITTPDVMPTPENTRRR